MPNSRQQRRAATREELIHVTRVVVYTTTGRAIEMDVDKIDIIAHDTGKPLFAHVEEAEIVQDGDWTGVRTVLNKKPKE